MKSFYLYGLAWGLALSGCSGYTSRGVSKSSVVSVTPTATPTATPTPSNSSSATPTPSVTVRPFLQQIVHTEIKRSGTNMGPFAVTCPSGFLLTGGGLWLKKYVGGSVKPDASYPHPTQQSWIVTIGGPQTGHKDNVWEAYAVCLKDPEFPNLQRQVIQSTVQPPAEVHHICGNDKVITDAGTRLAIWNGGRNNPESVFVDPETGDLITRSGNTSNSWELYYICLEKRNYLFSTPTEDLDALNLSVAVRCSGGRVLAGAGGGIQLTAYNQGDPQFRRSIPGLWGVDYQASPNATHEWKAYARCVKKP